MVHPHGHVRSSSEGHMDSWPLVIGFSAVAAAIFAYSFLIAA
jgi:hypothetical protein